MSNRKNNGGVRERTQAAKEADKKAAETSKLTPKVTIDEPNRTVPSKIKTDKQRYNNSDRAVKVPIYYSTIFVALTCVILTTIFCYYCVMHGPVSSMTKGLFIVLSTIFWCFFMAIFVPPVPQTQSYHNFADRRSLRQLIPSLSFLNIRNALDVLSNIPFLIVGVWGLCLLLSPKTIVFLTSFEKLGWIIFFISIAFVCIGSSYYHLSPSNGTLVWDRLPMSVGFSSLLGLLIDERINPIFGKTLFPFLLSMGFASCAYWYYKDDLRAYIIVQFFPMLYIPLLLLISSPVYSHTIYYIYACIFYALAKACEVADKQVFRLSGKNFSGHTLKHILAAIGIGIILYMLKIRVIL